MASIQQRGDSYLLTVSAGYGPNGKRVRRTKTVKVKNITEAKKELAKFQVEVEAGEYIAPEKLTIEGFIPDWENKYATSQLSESTIAFYLGHINNHIIPNLGHMRLDQLKPMHVVNFMDSLKDKLSPRTIQDVHRILRNVMSRAVDWQIIKSNPLDNVKKPKNTRKREVNVYEENEVRGIFESIQNESPHWRVMITLALSTGLRRGELLALEWEHIDLKEGTIQVKQSYGRGKEGRRILKDPKSANSKRIIHLSSSVVELMKSYRVLHKRERMKVLDMLVEREHEFIFCNIDGTPFYPTTPTTWWKRFTTRNKIRFIRFHDLRHTSATLLINQGVHPKIISERLGHSNIRITMDTYGHALKSADKEAANKLDKFFQKSNAN